MEDKTTVDKYPSLSKDFADKAREEKEEEITAMLKILCPDSLKLSEVDKKLIQDTIDFLTQENRLSITITTNDFIDAIEEMGEKTTTTPQDRTNIQNLIKRFQLK